MDFDAYYAELQTELEKLVNQHFRKYRSAAQNDVTEYLRVSKGRLKDYTRLLETGILTADERDFLAQGLKENAILFSLKESGRSVIALKRFAEAVVGLSLELALGYVVKSVI